MLVKPSSCSGCSLYEPPYGKHMGFSVPCGTGKNGVMIVAEALGKDEEIEGMALVGKSGYTLFQQLKRVDIDRDDFTIFNTIACRPPDNKLTKMPYADQAIAHCAPNLDRAIAGAREVARSNGKVFVIVTLGAVAFKRVLGLDHRKDHELLKLDYYSYPFWSDKYQAWVLNAPHPAYLLRGNTELWPVIQFVFKRALEIAGSGLKLDEEDYLLNPDPDGLDGYIKGYERSLQDDPDNPLSYDIETPYKKKIGDEDEVGKEEDADHTILRISFSYWFQGNTYTTSVKWSAEYLAGIERLFSIAKYVLGWNCPTPDQRVLTSDLRWVMAKDLRAGDSIIGLDEEVKDGYRIRRCKPSRVLVSEPGFAEVFAVEFSDGPVVKVTGEHPWLLSQRNRKGHEKTSAWVKTSNLVVGQKIQRMFNVWCEDVSKEAGYLAGFFDGEGHISGAANGTIRVGAAQNNGITLDHVLGLLTSKGFISKTKYAKREKDKNCCNFVIDGGIGPSAEFLGSIRPVRLLNKFRAEMLGPVWRPRVEPLTITRITNLGTQEIVRLATDTRTYFLEGFAAHNSDKYDHPRVSRHVKIKGIGLDGMVAWHILNTSLPKSLGFVTPYYWQNTLAWKYLADKEPAFYNAKDADAALRCFMGIKKDLIANRLWHVYERHWMKLHEALKYMSGVGVLRDSEMRDDAEKKMSAILDDVEQKMDEAVPLNARKIKIYKKTPKVITEGMFQLIKEFPVKYCGTCGVSRQRIWKAHASLCGGETVEILEPTTVWGKPLDFKISKLGMTNYQRSLKHQAILDRREHKVTYDADAISLLIKKYPSDPLYPRILEHRKVQKLLSTYVGITLPDGRMHGGMPVGRDGRIHTVYGRDASTLRFTSEDPNLQNLPRPNPNDPLANIIRNLIIAQSGSVLYARDFSGIEAVLTGYFALDPKYIRLAKRDVHTYYTVYAIYELEGGARIKASDLPSIDWPDDRLFPYLEQLKKEFKSDRNNLYKHLVHAANFKQGARGAREKIFSETGIEYPVATVQKVMDVYYALFPKIKQWHKNVLDEAEKDGYLRNPFDYVHRFNIPYAYKKEFGEWVKKDGEDANAVIAFKPQSTAVGIITEAILRLYFNRFEEAGRYLRLQVHDELLSEVPRNKWEEVDVIMKEEMEREIPQMRLPESWKMGTYLNILTEAKIDLNVPSRWGSMKSL